MGLFDRFKGGAKLPKAARPKNAAAAKWADRVEKRAQNYDRQEAIQALSDMASADAVEVLLKRFTFRMQRSGASCVRVLKRSSPCARLPEKPRASPGR